MDDDIYDMTGNPLADQADVAPIQSDAPEPPEDPQGVDDVPDHPDTVTAADTAPAPEAGAVSVPEPAQPAAPADPISDWVRSTFGVEPDQFKEMVSKELEVVTAAQTEAQVEESLKPRLEQLWEQVNAGQISEEGAGAIYQAELRAAHAEAKAARAEQAVAQQERARQLERIRAEFPGVPASGLETLAAVGLPADHLRNFAAEMHKAVTAAGENAVARYNAAKAAKGQTAQNHAPARGAAPDIEGDPLDFDALRSLSWSDLTGV